MTYSTWSADASRESRDGMDLIDLRAYLTPFESLKQLSFELGIRHGRQRQPDRIHRPGMRGRLAVRGSWKPKLSYRYAIFEGDDPNTKANGAFDGLWTSFYDLGYLVAG